MVWVLDLGEPKAFNLIGALELLAARDADRPLTIHPQCAAELSADEWILVRALTAERSYQRGACRARRAGRVRAALGRRPWQPAPPITPHSSSSTAYMAPTPSRNIPRPMRFARRLPSLLISGTRSVAPRYRKLPAANATTCGMLSSALKA